MSDNGIGIAPPGFGLPDASHVGGVRLQIGDLSRSVRYYTDVLGLRVLRDGAGYAALSPHGADLTLIELHEVKGAARVSPRGQLGLFHFAILLPDRAHLGAFFQHLSTLGETAGASDHLVSEALYLRDPDGLGIEVYADRPRAVWQKHGQEIQMATEPLDTADLINAAASTKWSGMPEGTRMGHVHLHVGELHAAERFYHAALGFDKVVWSYPGALFLSAGGYHHHLGINVWAAHAAPPGPRDAQLLVWDLIVPDTAGQAGVAKSLQDAGFVVEQGAGEMTTRDPWGTRLRIRVADES